MDIRSWVSRAAEYGQKAFSHGFEAAGSGLGYVTGLVGNLRLFGATVSSDPNCQFDERHYLLIPDPTAAEGYSLAIRRCLPEGVPPINELPKRRILHLPHVDAEAMLHEILIRQSQSEELQRPSSNRTLSQRTRELVDSIDALDNKVFHGIFLIGGLVALFNPLVGAAVAAKALIPSLGLLASKYGLRIAGDKMEQRELERRASQAKQDVLNQFKQSKVESHQNEVLAILDQALRTTEDEFDPMLAMHGLLQNDLPAEIRKWNQLAAAAIVDVFDEALNAIPQDKHRRLDREDKRFLDLLKSIVADNKQ
jgi:hypothetical protein